MTAVLPETAPPGPGVDDGIVHAVCPQCHPEIDGLKVVAICGAKDPSGVWIEEEDPRLCNLCVVCLDLFPAGCPICGLRP